MTTLDRQDPVHIAFLGCGFITRLHSRGLRSLGRAVRCSYASRDVSRAEAFCRKHRGFASYGEYDAALADDRVQAVIIAVPPRFHLELTLRALAAGKHVLVEKPAFLTLDDYDTAARARDRANRVVMVAENDHFKPLAVALRRLLASNVIGPLLFASFTSIAKRFKASKDWRNDEKLAGGDAFFEEGIHWLHLAGSLGPRITEVAGLRPNVSRDGADRRAKSILVTLRYDIGAVGTIYYSREIPSLFRGVRLSTLSGRDGIITFESNGGFVFVRGRGGSKLILPGFRDIRGYRAMYNDFLRAIRTGAAPEMSVERAREDHRLMNMIHGADSHRPREMQRGSTSSLAALST